MEREFVAQNVANRLNETEAAVEAAVFKASILMSEIYQAKIELGLAGMTGAGETAKIGRAIAALQAAHSELVDAHHGLAVLGRALHLRPRGYGWKPNSASATPADKISAT